ncbi:uncharacterized protein LOC106654315 isoform X1 [Trichogramma pretiosum]|uniref:uncharacterized protein LOC106654315 isoform X1 n=2 Tax=Trichogramma pretiosum TaxID=7493 RepID=UPI0006C94286|nr:uncharacterized protein LOC106654315 isoform X1 [Trichogramma pretiosum]
MENLSNINANKKAKMLPQIVESNPVETLKTVMNKVGFNPNYEITELPHCAENPCFKFMSKLNFQGITIQAFGKSKKESKQAAAVAMLQKLGKYPTEETNIQAPAVATSQKFVNNPAVETSVQASPPLNSVEVTEGILQSLNTLCSKEGIELPVYTELEPTGPQHCRMFSMRCTLLSISTEGHGKCKKIAKQYAAKLMFEKIIQNPNAFKRGRVNFISTESNSQDLLHKVIANKSKINNDSTESNSQDLLPKDVANKSKLKSDGTESNSQELLLKVIVNGSKQSKNEQSNLSEGSSSEGGIKKLHQKLLHRLMSSFADPGNTLKTLQAIHAECNDNCSEENMSKLKTAFQSFLDSAKIDFHHMMVKTAEPFTAMLVIQLNTDPEILRISLGSSMAEAELRVMGKILATLDSIVN